MHLKKLLLHCKELTEQIHKQLISKYNTKRDMNLKILDSVNREFSNTCTTEILSTASRKTEDETS